MLRWEAFSVSSTLSSCLSFSFPYIPLFQPLLYQYSSFFFPAFSSKIFILLLPSYFPSCLSLFPFLFFLLFFHSSSAPFYYSFPPQPSPPVLCILILPFLLLLFFLFLSYFSPSSIFPVLPFSLILFPFFSFLSSFSYSISISSTSYSPLSYPIFPSPLRRILFIQFCVQELNIRSKVGNGNLLMNRVIFSRDLSQNKCVRNKVAQSRLEPVLLSLPYFVFPQSIRFSALMMGTWRSFETQVKTHKTVRQHSSLY
jgi:hypothetical protein